MPATLRPTAETAPFCDTFRRQLSFTAAVQSAVQVHTNPSMFITLGLASK